MSPRAGFSLCFTPLRVRVLTIVSVRRPLAPDAQQKPPLPRRLPTRGPPRHSTRTLLGLTDARPPRGRRACTVTDDREVLRCVDEFKSSFQKVFSPDSVKNGLGKAVHGSGNFQRRTARQSRVTINSIVVSISYYARVHSLVFPQNINKIHPPHSSLDQVFPSGNSTPLPVHLPSKLAGPPLGEKSIKISPSPFTTPDSDHSRVSSPFVQPGVPSAPRTVKVDPLPRISRAHL